MTASAARAARPNGWWGMAIFVATEATLFGALVGTWIYLRIENHHWPPRPLPNPPVLTPVLLTLLLLTTSVAFQLAWRAGRDWDRVRAWWLIAYAFAAQVFYLAWELHDFHDALHTWKPQSSAFGSVYVTLLGADHAHVILGALLSIWLLLRLSARLTRYRLIGLQAVTFYVHAVNVITAVVLVVTVLPSV